MKFGEEDINFPYVKPKLTSKEEFFLTKIKEQMQTGELKPFFQGEPSRIRINPYALEDEITLTASNGEMFIVDLRPIAKLKETYYLKGFSEGATHGINKASSIMNKSLSELIEKFKTESN